MACTFMQFADPHTCQPIEFLSLHNPCMLYCKILAILALLSKMLICFCPCQICFLLIYDVYAYFYACILLVYCCHDQWVAIYVCIHIYTYEYLYVSTNVSLLLLWNICSCMCLLLLHILIYLVLIWLYSGSTATALIFVLENMHMFIY